VAGVVVAPSPSLRRGVAPGLTNVGSIPPRLHSPA
jgi:hypothetical protein